MSTQAVDLNSYVRDLLLKYKDDNLNKVGDWNMELDGELSKLLSMHGDLLLSALKDFIFEFETQDLNCVEMLFESTLVSNEFMSIVTKTTLLEILDRAKNISTRNMALSALIQFDCLENLQSMYRKENNVHVKRRIGEIVIAMLVKKAGLQNPHLSGCAYKGDIVTFKKRLDQLSNKKDKISIVKFLRDCEYISAEIKDELDQINRRLSGD